MVNFLRVTGYQGVFRLIHREVNLTSRLRHLLIPRASGVEKTDPLSRAVGTIGDLYEITKRLAKLIGVRP